MAAEGGEVSGSRSDFIKKCSPCFKKGLEKESGQYCYSCKTFFCGNCVEKHDELFGDHRLTSTGSVDIDAALTLHTEMCQQHGKYVHLYCKDDKTVGCEMCMASEHRSCAEVAYLPKVASSLLGDININEIKTKLKQIVQRLVTIELRQKSSIADIEADRDRCIQEIDEHHEELSILVDKIVKSSKDKVLQTFERLHTDLQHGNQEVKKCLADLETSQKQLECKQGNDVELLLEIKKQEKQEQSTDKVLNKALKSLQVNGFTVEVDEHLRVLLSELESLVTVSLKSAPLKVTKRRQLDVSVKDEKVCEVRGSCLLPDGSVILVDRNNNLLKRLDQQSLTMIDQYLMPDMPLDVCCIDRNNVAVTQANRKVVFLSVNPSLSVTHSIQMNHPCGYVTYSRGELFINVQKKMLYVYDVKGTLLRIIDKDVTGQELFSYIRHVAVSDDGEKVYVAGGRQGVITLDRQGKLLDTQDPNDKLNDVGVVCPDDAGGLFVAAVMSHIVVHVGADGKTITEVLTGSDGLLNPVSMCYDRVHKRLFVSQNGNNPLYVCGFE